MCVVIVGLALLVEANSPGRFAFPPGLYWVAAAALIAAALWSRPKRSGDYHHHACAIYLLVAEAPVPLEQLMKEIGGNSFDDQYATQVKRTVVTLLDEGNLAIVDGLVSLARGSSAKGSKEVVGHRD